MDNEINIMFDSSDFQGGERNEENDLEIIVKRGTDSERKRRKEYDVVDEIEDPQISYVSSLFALTTYEEAKQLGLCEAMARFKQIKLGNHMDIEGDIQEQYQTFLPFEQNGENFIIKHFQN